MARSGLEVEAERCGFRDLRRGRSCHFPPPNLGSFWGVSVGERQCTTANGNGKKYPHNLAFQTVAGVRRGTGIDPLTAKTGVRVP